MINLLRHLWPDFSKLFTGDPNELSVWFWMVMASIFAMTILLLCRHSLHFRRRMRALRSLLDGQSKENLAQTRRETLQKAREIKAKDVGMLWDEFDESLVSSSDHEQLFNTLEADHFFNARTLAPGLTASRLLAAAPSFLVALGVLGTFVGLTIGLAQLNIGSQATVEQLRSGIDVLIQGAAVAFMTSVWGVIFSLALNFIEKMLERGALGSIQALQYKIDSLYPRLSAEQSLLRIADYSKESSQALQELHERIGNRLQETLSGVSEAMQQALIDALNTIMAPAIQSLVSATSQQSTQALTKLVGNFMEGLSSAGREQGALMQQAAADVNAAVSGMTERLNQLFHTLNDQHMHQLENAQEQSRQFEAQLERIGSGAEQRQQQLERRFSELTESLGSQLAGQLGTAQRRDEERQAMFERSLAEVNQRQHVLLEQVVTATREQLYAIAEAGNERHDHLEQGFSRLMMNLNTQLNAQVAEAEQREQSRQQRFAEQLESVAGQQQTLLQSIAQAVQTTQQQSHQMAVQHQQLMIRLQQATEAAAASSKHLDSSANQLGLLSANLRQAAEVLGQRLESVTQRIEAAGNQNARLAEHLQTQTSSLSQLQGALLAAAQRFEEAASQARNGFGAMQSHQQEFLASVRSEFTALGEMLRKQVESIEKQAEEWLHSYSSEVQQQINERMAKWNEVSLAYADQMLHVVNAVSNVVDELEAR